MRFILIFFVRVYRYCISPLTPASCRFMPTCSEYAVESLTKHGALRGSWLTFKRIIRCHPLCRGGLDPVPPAHGDLPPHTRQSGA